MRALSEACVLTLFRASSYAERLRLRIAVIHGQKEIEHDDDETDGRNSPPPMIEQEPEEPAVYVPPAGTRRQRNDSSKLSFYPLGSNYWNNYVTKGVFMLNWNKCLKRFHWLLAR